MGDRDRAHDRQTQTAPGDCLVLGRRAVSRTRLVGSPEALKGERQKVRGKSRAVIGHRDRHCFAAAERRQSECSLNGASGRGEAHRVSEQVVQRLTEAIGVNLGRDWISRSVA